MDSQVFKNAYMKKFMNNGPEMAALVGVPSVDGKGRVDVQIDVPGLGDTERVGAVGVYGNEKVTDPRQLEFMTEAGMAPYLGQMSPTRSDTGNQFPVPAHPSFNREATEQYMPGVMKGIGPGMMPAIRY